MNFTDMVYDPMSVPQAIMVSDELNRYISKVISTMRNELYYSFAVALVGLIFIMVYSYRYKDMMAENEKTLCWWLSVMFAVIMVIDIFILTFRVGVQ